MGQTEIECMLTTELATIRLKTKGFHYMIARMKVAFHVAMAVSLICLLVDLVPVVPAQAPQSRLPLRRVQTIVNETELGYARFEKHMGDEERDATYAFGGRVVGWDEKPIKDAKIYWCHFRLAAAKTRFVAVTDTDGFFKFSIKSSEIPWDIHSLYSDPLLAYNLVVVAKDCGIGSVNSPFAVISKRHNMAVQRTSTIKLPKAGLVISGRVTDSDGASIEGARVRVLGVYSIIPRSPGTGRMDDVVDWRNRMGKSTSAEAALGQLVGCPNVENALTETHSGADGKFSLEGIGENRVCRLRIEGPQIEANDVYVATAPFEKIRLAKRFKTSECAIIYGATFVHVAAPGRVVQGIVRDKTTSFPIAGARIANEQRHLEPIDLTRTTIQTVTDETGAYRLEGLPQSSEDIIVARPPTGKPYFEQFVELPGADGVKPTEINFQLNHGVWVTGKITDKVTNEPVHAILKYYAWGDVRLLQPDSYSRALDGAYRIIALPQAGTIAAMAIEKPYVLAIGLDVIREKYIKNPELAISHEVFACDLNTIVEFQPKMGLATNTVVDIKLDPGRTAKGSLRDSLNNPLTGVLIGRARELSYPNTRHDVEDWEPEALKESTFEAKNLNPGTPRELLFYHPTKGLAGSLLIRGDEKTPPIAKLQPCGVVSGRILDAKGQPTSKLQLRFSRLIAKPDVTNPWILQGTLPKECFFTNSEGRFYIEGLAPGVEYTLCACGADKDDRIGVIFERLKVNAGETKALGDIQLNPEE